jgi:hypothetical protein
MSSCSRGIDRDYEAHPSSRRLDELRAECARVAICIRQNPAPSVCTRAERTDDDATRAIVIVLGDARTNGRPPRDDVFAAITARAGRTFSLNHEPRLYWVRPPMVV